LEQPAADMTDVIVMGICTSFVLFLAADYPKKNENVCGRALAETVDKGYIAPDGDGGNFSSRMLPIMPVS